MVEAATYVNEDRIPITNVTNLPISEELAGLFDLYPDIDEVEFEALMTYVMKFYIQSYEAGNPIYMEGKNCGTSAEGLTWLVPNLAVQQITS